MKRRKKGPVRIEVEAKSTRYQPDPHKRHRVIENKKLYSRKAQSGKAAPSDRSGVLPV
jgi:hypothetical protein